ncbi:MAG: hypothetical protein KatS3mg065_1147 [Chloroflexota bacterium]|nr:MAG: hypothetical protein KatS3mg065_1147 [Chloroflexota bacterium]
MELEQAIRKLVREEIAAALAERDRLVRLVAIRCAALRLNVSRSTVYALIGRGELRTVTIGRRRLVPEAALVEFIESRR